MPDRYKRWTEPALLDDGDGASVLFRPFLPPEAGSAVARQLETRWIGQGPLVDQFEEQFAERFTSGQYPVAVNSGTSALHLAYTLAGIGHGDEVVVPLFTCTATSIPLLHMGARLRFSDVDPITLNSGAAEIEAAMTERTRMIVCVHYGGLPVDLAEISELARDRGCLLVQDNAHALGATYQGRQLAEFGDYSMYSFQAIKHITTGDGGMLAVRSKAEKDTADRLRWFGIDRRAKQGGTWANDIKELGFKYQMTDISAALGLSALPHFDGVLSHRQALFATYVDRLQSVAGIRVVGGSVPGDRTHAAWLATVVVDRGRDDLIERLRQERIEAGLVHYRNDMYSIFSDARAHFPAMDSVEDGYLCLPLHPQLTLADVHRICDVISSGW